MQAPQAGMNRGARLVAPFWIAAVAITSLQSQRPPQTAALHRLFHFTAFAVTAVILRRAGAGRWAPAGSACAAAMLGAALELLQTRMRYPIEWWDMRDDALGALIGALAYQAVSRLWAKRRGRPKGFKPHPQTKEHSTKPLWKPREYS